jgi:hypothetical protein
MAAAVPASAQTFRFTGRFRNFNQPPPAPGGPGNVLEPFLPSGVTQQFPLAPFQQPDILRNYLQMRATSPRPNEFMGGQFNPQYISNRDNFADVTYRRSSFGAPVIPEVVVFGSPTYYGGYNAYPGYGAPYPAYAPQQPLIIQREIHYVHPDTRLAPNGVRPEPRVEPDSAPPEGRAAPRTEPAADDYYLSRPRSETLDDAVQDIRRAWLNADFSRVKSRIRDDARVRIYLKGKYQYAVAGADFAQMTRDAMTRIDTTAFDLDRVANVGADRAFASGKHTYVDPDKTKREVHVSYGLVREDGRWKIAEAGSSTTPIRQHEE